MHTGKKLTHIKFQNLIKKIKKEKNSTSLAGWCTLVFFVLRLRQEDWLKFKDSLSYIRLS